MKGYTTQNLKHQKGNYVERVHDTKGTHPKISYMEGVHEIKRFTPKE